MHRCSDLPARAAGLPQAQGERAHVALGPVWLADRKARLANDLAQLGLAARNETITKGSIKDRTLRIDRLAADPPDRVEEQVLDLYRRPPPVRITDPLLEVDVPLSFTNAFILLTGGYLWPKDAAA